MDLLDALLRIAPAVLPIALMAGLVGLDVVSFPQAMISRPIVGATIAGAFFGAPVAGLTCGAALECLAIESLPVGASRYPEWGSASVVAGALAAHGVMGAALPHPGVFALAVAIGITTAWLGGISMTRLRRLIAAFAKPRLPQLAAGNRRTVVGLQVFGMTADLLRGAVLGVSAFIPAMIAAEWVTTHWSVGADLTRAYVVAAVAAVAAAAVWKDFHAINYTRRLFLISLTLGTLVVMAGA